MILCDCEIRPTETQSQDCRRRSRCGRSLPLHRGRDAVRARRVRRRVEARAGATDQAEEGRQSRPRILRHRAARIPESGLSAGRPVHPGVVGVSEAPLLRGAAVGRAVPWRRASSAPGVPGSRRQQPPTDLLRVCPGVVHRAPAHRRVPLQRFNTPRGTILASSPEGTAVDLVGYERRAGGLDHVATVLSELAERIDPQRLLTAAQTAPVSWAQRLGYLLERVGAADRVISLKAYVRRTGRQVTALLPAAGREHAPRSDDWLLRINVDVEPDL